MLQEKAPLCEPIENVLPTVCKLLNTRLRIEAEITKDTWNDFAPSSFLATEESCDSQ